MKRGSVPVLPMLGPCPVPELSQRPAVLLALLAEQRRMLDTRGEVDALYRDIVVPARYVAHALLTAPDAISALGEQCVDAVENLANRMTMEAIYSDCPPVWWGHSNQVPGQGGGATDRVRGKTSARSVALRASGLRLGWSCDALRSSGS